MADLPKLQKHSWFHRYVFLPLAKDLMRVLFLVLGPIFSYQRRRIPKHGPLLILANHLADVDPILIQVSSQRSIHFMAKSELFDMPLLGRIIRWFGAFPVKRGEPDRASMRHAVELMRMGECVCVFPEGQLSESGRLQELKPGIALLLRQSGAAAICCGISNTNRIMPYGRLTPKISWHKTPVHWGEPKQFEKGVSNEEILQWATEELLSLTGERSLTK